MSKSGYSIYNDDYKNRVIKNYSLLPYPPLPNNTYDIIYADPPCDYGGKTQFDKSSKIENNKNYDKKIFLSSANFKYPTVKIKDLKKYQ